MKNYSGSVGKIESFSTVDGPGIRSVVFLNGCTLRCAFCHNPEFLKTGNMNTTPEELAKSLIRNKPYFKNGGGVTFSGGEPLLQSDFIIETAKLLKKESLHITLDTAGIGKYNKDIFNCIDLILLDIKGSNRDLFQRITAFDKLDEELEFLRDANKRNIPVIIRQVIIPGINDTKENILELKELLKPFKYERIELLPYQTMAKSKYKELGIPYKLESTKYLSIEKLEELRKYL